MDEALTDLLAHPALDRAASLELGVSTSAFQSEGDLDLPGRPRTNWYDAQQRGTHERIGHGVGLWRRFDEAARRCEALGLKLFRLTVEWARLRPDGPRLSRRAVEGYASRLMSLRARGMEPVVTLHHFTHPRWLGPDFWLRHDAHTLFAAHAVEALDALDAALGGAPVTRVLTINEPNMLALASYVAGVFPHGEPSLAEGSALGIVRAWRALDAMLAGHALAYEGIRASRARRGMPPPDVSLNLNLIDLHGLGAGIFDLLRAPSLGVPIAGLDAWIEGRRARWHAALFEGEAGSPRARLAGALDRAWSRISPLSTLVRTCEALYGSKVSPLDHLGIDLYDPYTAHQLRAAPALVEALAGFDLAGVMDAAQGGVALAEPWAWAPAPEALVAMVRALNDGVPALPVDVVECGMSVERPAGEPRARERADGLTRPAFLRAMLRAALAARVAHEQPLRAWLHWTLVDNYELGRWSPRFGLWSLGDPSGERAGAWGARDAQGEDAAGVLGAFARAVRTSPVDRAALTALFDDRE